MYSGTNSLRLKKNTIPQKQRLKMEQVVACLYNVRSKLIFSVNFQPIKKVGNTEDAKRDRSRKSKRVVNLPKCFMREFVTVRSI